MARAGFRFFAFGRQREVLAPPLRALDKRQRLVKLGAAVGFSLVAAIVFAAVDQRSRSPSQTSGASPREAPQPGSANLGAQVPAPAQSAQTPPPDAAPAMQAKEAVTESRMAITAPALPTDTFEPLKPVPHDPAELAGRARASTAAQAPVLSGTGGGFDATGERSPDLLTWPAPTGPMVPAPAPELRGQTARVAVEQPRAQAGTARAGVGAPQSIARPPRSSAEPEQNIAALSSSTEPRQRNAERQASPGEAAERQASRGDVQAHRLEKGGTPTECLAAPLKAVLADMETRFGPVTLISTTHLHTDNHSPGSTRAKLHEACKAVDIRTTKDVKQILAYLRTRPEVGGVNTYRNGVVHFDLNAGFKRTQETRR